MLSQCPLPHTGIHPLSSGKGAGLRGEEQSGVETERELDSKQRVMDPSDPVTCPLLELEHLQGEVLMVIKCKM